MLIGLIKTWKWIYGDMFKDIKSCKPARAIVGLFSQSLIQYKQILFAIP